MKIAIDFDGTIADTNKLKQQYALSRFGIRVPSYLCDRTSFSEKYGLEMYQKIISAIYTRNYTKITSLVPGALSAIRELAKRHELILISARPTSRLCWAKEWLKSKGIYTLFSYVQSSNKKTKYEICKLQRCRVLIDDDMRHLKQGKTYYKCILLKLRARKPPEQLPTGIFFANSWGSVKEIIYALETEFS